jgi:hypothetical protein
MVGGMTVLRNERGMALAMVIISLVVVGALMAAALMIGIQEQRMGESTRWLRKSSGLAEGGVHEILRGWDPATNNGLNNYPAAGSSQAIAQSTSPSGTGVYAGTVSKLTDQIYLLDVTGRDSATLTGKARGDGARQRVGLLTRVLPLPVDVQAAFTIGAPVNFGGGNVFVRGTDNVPSAWSASCPPAGAAVAGVRAKNSGDASNSNGQMTGTPPVLITPSMDSTTFMQYGNTTYNALAASATIQLNPGSYAPAPVTSGSTCTASTTNWGSPLAPTGPCGKRYPIVHINNFAGTTTITGGSGQGVLLVDGDLTISGAFTYYGLIIVRGKMTTTAGGSPTVYGALLVQSMNFATTSFAGSANIYYSACALQRTRDAISNPTMLRSRGWIELQ